MADNPKSTFARRVRAAKPRTTKYEIRDDVVSGLALAVQPTGVRTWFLARMVRGRRRYATLGSADTMTIPEARREARRLIASYIEPAKTDNGPRTPGHPMDAFAGEFLDRRARHWKTRTLETNAYMVRNHILPAFGHMTVDAITVEHVRDWFASLSDRPGVANRAMPVLSMMMRMAELWGYRAHNSNPCRNTRRYRMKPVERFLTVDEMARLNAVLTRDEFWCPHIVAVIRLLMLTGCRRNEILTLKWEDIDLEHDELRLRDANTGARAVPLSPTARGVLTAIPRQPGNPWVIFGRGPGTHLANLNASWEVVRREAGLEDMRLHDLRHSFASRALALGESLPTIARLLGHS